MSRKGKPLISVIVPTLNEEKYIERCLKSIKNQSFKNFEIILSDGSSEDKTVEKAKKFVDKIVISKERGEGKQKNEGARVAKGKILFFAEADMILHKDCLEEAFKKIEEGYIGGKFYESVEHKSFSCKLYEAVSRFSDNLCLKFFKFPSGSPVLFIRKDLYEKVGGFHDKLYFWDLHFFKRARRFGKFCLVKKVRVKSVGREFKSGFLKICLKRLSLWFLTLLGIER
jgi:glycosyltransferase involved in cell wall biosynthesis